MSTDNSTIHMVQTGAVACQTQSQCWEIGQCHEHTRSPKIKCPNCQPVLPPALTMLCWALRPEALKVWFDKMLMVFPTSDVLLTSFAASESKISVSGGVFLRCGPAKHGSRSTNRKTKQALELIVKNKLGRRELHLQFTTYHGVQHDFCPLNKSFVEIIGRNRGIEHFSLSIKNPYPGPFGVLSHNDSDHLAKRIACMEHVFRCYVTSRDGMDRNDGRSADFVRQFNRQLDHVIQKASTGQPKLQVWGRDYRRGSTRTTAVAAYLKNWCRREAAQMKHCTAL